jgi:hypothetical protein
MRTQAALVFGDQLWIKRSRRWRGTSTSIRPMTVIVRHQRLRHKKGKLRRGGLLAYARAR